MYRCVHYLILFFLIIIVNFNTSQIIFFQSLLAPEPDPALKITHYERTFEQNEDLGLNDIKTENYETSLK
jgi:hypothetical protein